MKIDYDFSTTSKVIDCYSHEFRVTQKTLLTIYETEGSLLLSRSASNPEKKCCSNMQDWKIVVSKNIFKSCVKSRIYFRVDISKLSILTNIY